MRENYWVLRLKASTFLKILWKSRKTDISDLTYVEETKTAGRILKLCRKLNISTPSLHKIPPRESVAGPVLYLSNVRNDKGEVISLDIYHRILAARHRILDKFLDSHKSFSYFTNKRSLNSVSAAIGLRIAIDTRNAVYMAHYAKWKRYRDDDEPKARNVLIIPGSNFSTELASIFEGEKTVDRVEIENYPSLRTRRFLRVAGTFLHCFKKTGFADSFRLLRKNPVSPSKHNNDAQSYDHSPGRMMITYGVGLLKDKRNDLSFFHAAKMDPRRLLVFFRVDRYPPTDEELAWLKANKIDSIAGPHMQTDIPGVPKWKLAESFEKELKEKRRLFIQTAGECLTNWNKHSLWFLDTLWDMEKEVAFWKDFFIQNKVSILVNPNPSEFNFIPALAMSETGGIVVEAERSIRFDYCTYIHNAATSVSFATGPYSLTQIPEPAFARYSVQTGALNVVDSLADDEEIRELKKRSKIVVTVFDESPNDVFFGNSIGRLYRAMIELVKKDDRFVLYIKTKKNDILESLPEIAEEIKRLEQAGKCVPASWKVSAAAASTLSDLVVSAPSTAAFESVLTGTRTVVFNPMRSGSRLFYRNNGLNRRVFEDGESMVTAIRGWADGNDLSIGDCSEIVQQIDPFNDKRGAERIGNYLTMCFDGFKTGLAHDDVVKQANERYAAQWGTDKITDQNSFEIQCAPKYN